MPEVAYVHDAFCPLAEARVSVEDRSYQFGDGVYEVIVAYQGRPWLLQPHLARLRRSADAIEVPFDFDARPLEPIIEEGLRRCEFPEAMVYIQISRGVAPRSHLIPESITPTLVMTFRRLVRLSDEQRHRGVRIMSTPETRWANCYIKAVTLLPNVLARQEARKRGFDDALFVAPNGEVRECTSSNVFMTRDGKLHFPPRTHAVLHGCTQGFLLECAAASDLPVVEHTITLDALRAADEVFISSTTIDVLGVTQIDDRPVADGRVGPITNRLYQTFRERVLSACRPGV